jgi:hypothetical protein
VKVREQRFFGNGNCAVGALGGRGWRVACHKCPATYTVNLPTKNNFLEADIVLKMLRKKGWRVGATAEDDVCQRCLADEQKAAVVQESSIGHGLQKVITDLRNEKYKLQCDKENLQSEVAGCQQRIRDLQDQHQQHRQDQRAAFFDLLRTLHEHLIDGAIEAAISKIQQQAPTWPWPKRLPKKQGRLAPKSPTISDPNFDQYLADIEREWEQKIQAGRK